MVIEPEKPDGKVIDFEKPDRRVIEPQNTRHSNMLSKFLETPRWTLLSLVSETSKDIYINNVYKSCTFFI